MYSFQAFDYAITKLETLNDAKTTRYNFWVWRDKIRAARFLHQKGKFNYYTSEELIAHVLEMPYNRRHANKQFSPSMQGIDMRDPRTQPEVIPCCI